MKRKQLILIALVAGSAVLSSFFTNMVYVTDRTIDERNIASLYVAYFQRVPEKNGMDYWKNQITSFGATKESISQGFWKASIEMNLGGYSLTMTDSQFVEKVYWNVGSRSFATNTLTAGEVKYWVDELNNVYRGDKGLLISRFIGDYVKTNIDLYKGVFPDSTINSIRNAQAKFLNRVQVGLIGYANGFNPTGTPQEITNRCMQVLAGVDHTQASVIKAITSSATGLGIGSFPSGYKHKILVLGQSNAADFSDALYDAKTYVTYYDSVGRYEKFYLDTHDAAYSPFYTISPDYIPKRGSVWGKLGDKLNGSANTRIMFDTRAVGSSSVSAWAPGGRLHGEILDAMNRNQFTAVIFQQGETDNFLGTSESSYQAALEAIVNVIHAKDPNVRIYITKTSKMDFGASVRPWDPVIRAQQNVINKYPGFVRNGINTDLFDDTHRIVNDKNHFNQKGIDAEVNAWYPILNNLN